MKRLFTVCLLVCLLLLSFGAAGSTAAAQENVRRINTGVVYEAQVEEDDVLTEEAAAEPPITPLLGSFSPVIVLMIAGLTVGCVMFSLHKKRRA
ncbi:MAG: hypothetical protein Q4C48_10490 [Lachnospiraceae bacterium]|nr:hypothetical protein [Lachnospiraceae bacterium]